MKKLLVLSAIATLTSGVAFASDVAVGSHVPSVCKVMPGSASAVNFPILADGEQSSFDFRVKCNDYDGATLTLTSSEGHMQTVDGLDATGVGYTAALSAAPFNFILNATTGHDDLSESQTVGGSIALAGGVPGSVLLTVVGNPTYSGFYTDQLSLTVTAN